MKRTTRRLRAVLTALLLAGAACSTAVADVTMYRSATCGCCLKWVRHLEDAGFAVRVIDVDDMAQVKRERGVPAPLASCHTAEVDGYLIEGHVPARDVARLLEERPPLRGLAVPGMPIGSPGMEGLDPEPYAVIAFRDDGRAEVFSTYRP